MRQDQSAATKLTRVFGQSYRIPREQHLMQHGPQQFLLTRRAVEGNCSTSRTASYRGVAAR